MIAVKAPAETRLDVPAPREVGSPDFREDVKREGPLRRLHIVAVSVSAHPSRARLPLETLGTLPLAFSDSE